MFISCVASPRPAPTPRLLQIPFICHIEKLRGSKKRGWKKKECSCRSSSKCFGGRKICICYSSNGLCLLWREAAQALWFPRNLPVSWQWKLLALTPSLSAVGFTGPMKPWKVDVCQKCSRLCFIGSNQKVCSQRILWIMIHPHQFSLFHTFCAQSLRQFKSPKSRSDHGSGWFHLLIIVVSHFDMVAKQIKKTFTWLQFGQKVRQVKDNYHIIMRTQKQE